MHNALTEKLMARLLGLGAAFTTIFIVSGSVTDPVNAPKFLIIGILGSSVFATLWLPGMRTRLKGFQLAITFLTIFSAAALNSVLFSNSPITQNLYGSYGRNNGLLTYIFLVFIFLASLLLQDKANFEIIAKGLLLAGIINVIYCMWVIAFGDFIGWSNPYGNILGTLGNPNFIGSFLGIYFASAISFAMNKSISKRFRVLLLLTLPITIYEIYESHAIQGRVVAASGLTIIGFLYIRSKFGRVMAIAYSVLALFGGSLSLMGALQIGPLTDLIYKTSVSLRGQYWLAGWNTGKSHPMTGVGMDAFGDWYRRSRDQHALDLPGVNTTVNAAHNVFMDMFAFGGWPLFAAYLAINVLALFSLIRVVIRVREFNGTFALILTAWFGYQLQSIISINQIGLAVWGWLLSGTAIAYEKTTRNLNVDQSALPSKKNSKQIAPSARLTIAAGGLCGLLIALPPLTSDAKWRSAQLARTDVAISATMVPSYFNPMNSMRYAENIISLEQAGLFELSHKYAIQSVNWNPESFELWRLAYFTKLSTESEKQMALLNMKRLDPLNPDVLAR